MKVRLADLVDMPERKEYNHTEYCRIWRSKNKDKIKLIGKRYAENNPWVRNMSSLRSRCNDKKHVHYKYYGGKGVKCLISLNEVKYMWFRDKAYEMKVPSVDRIYSNGNYILNNCRFIERAENSRYNGNRKLTVKNVIAIRKLYLSEKDLNKIGKKYGVTDHTIRDIIKRITWKDI